MWALVDNELVQSRNCMNRAPVRLSVASVSDDSVVVACRGDHVPPPLGQISILDQVDEHPRLVNKRESHGVRLRGAPRGHDEEGHVRRDVRRHVRAELAVRWARHSRKPAGRPDRRLPRDAEDLQKLSGLLTRPNQVLLRVRQHRRCSPRAHARRAWGGLCEKGDPAMLVAVATEHFVVRGGREPHAGSRRGLQQRPTVPMQTSCIPWEVYISTCLSLGCRGCARRTLRL